MGNEKMSIEQAKDLLNKIEGDLNTTAEAKLQRDVTLGYSLEEWQGVNDVTHIAKVSLDFEKKTSRITFRRAYCFQKFEKIENLDTGVLSALRVYAIEENKNSLLLAWISDTLKENKKVLLAGCKAGCLKVINDKPAQPEKKA